MNNALYTAALVRRAAYVSMMSAEKHEQLRHSLLTSNESWIRGIGLVSFGRNEHD